MSVDEARRLLAAGVGADGELLSAAEERELLAVVEGAGEALANRVAWDDAAHSSYGEDSYDDLAGDWS